MIKKWNEFIRLIKESNTEENVWISEEDIQTYMVDLIDNRYTISVENGFVGEDRNGNDIFTDEVLSGRERTPAYYINIDGFGVRGDVDVADSLIQGIDYLNDITNSEAVFYDEDYEVIDGDRLSKLSIVGGIFSYGDDEESYHNKISVFVKSKDSIMITHKVLAELYKWDVDEYIDGKIYLHISLEDLADCILDRKTDYKDVLLGEDDDMDRYYHYDYTVDTGELFDYYLNKENTKLVIRKVIEEFGGMDELVSLNDKLDGKSEEEVIEFLLNERWRSTLNEICKDSDIIREIKSTYSDWYANASYDSMVEEVHNEFDSIVSDLFNYKKFKKDVTRNRNNAKYTESEQYYKIQFHNDWIDNIDGEYRSLDLTELFKEYCSREYFGYDLKPRFSDYATVDKDAFNKDIKHII